MADPALVKRLAAERIPLTVCPLSNVKLCIYPTMTEHNLAELLDAGLCATVNSDDPAYFGGYMNDNFLQVFAATRIDVGTDVDFGALTHGLLDYLIHHGARLYTEHIVKNITKQKDGTWKLRVGHDVGGTSFDVHAKFVFVGAGGGALKLLQKSGIAEAKGFGGFPVSGEFLRTDNPDVVARHQAKVYGKAAVGSPPMSVPHLDTRIVDGSASLMFGPYAGFNTKFLKNGSWTDLFSTIRPHNLIPMVRAGLANLDLVKYLVGQLAASKKTKFAALQEFMPTADPKDWYLITAGQRVQVMLNAGLSPEHEQTLGSWVDGIGLYRTEIPFMLQSGFPSEEEQVAQYQGMLQLFHEKPVTLRTLDIGADKQLPYMPIS
jgi:hypothetical protein